jgi:hypothetical protein
MMVLVHVRQIIPAAGIANLQALLASLQMMLSIIR